MPLYRIEKTVTIYAYTPGEMDRRTAMRLLKDAEFDGGGEESEDWDRIALVPTHWQDSLVYHPGQEDITGAEAEKLP